MERIDGRIIHDVYLDRVVFRETFTGDGSETEFTLSGPDAAQVTFKYGAWAVANVKTTLPSHVTKTTKKPAYDSLIPLTRTRIAVDSINAAGVVTLNEPPRAIDFYIWYWYDLPNHHLLENYYREDFVASMEEEATAYGVDITVDTTDFAGIFTGTDDTVQKALDTADDHLHDGRYYTETELANQTAGSEGSKLIGFHSHTLHDHLLHLTNKGVMEGCVVSDVGTLDITWTSGMIWDSANEVTMTIASGSATCDNNLVNYLYADYSVSTTVLQRSTTFPTETDMVLVAIIWCQDSDIWQIEHSDWMNLQLADLHSASLGLFPSWVVSGMTVSEDENVDNALDVTMAAGVLYHGNHHRETIAQIDTRTTALVRHFHVDSAWDSETNAEIDTAWYDNGADKADATGGKWFKAVFLYTEGKLHWVYPRVQYATRAQANAAPIPAIPPGLARAAYLTAIVYGTDDANFTTTDWIDIRVGLAEAIASAPVTNHDYLAGISANDHHAESHSIVSHSDIVDATGANIEELTGGGDTTLHDHDGITENTNKVTESTTVTSPLVLSTYDISIPAATSIANGYMTSTYAGKLDGIDTGAKDDQSEAEILTLLGLTGVEVDQLGNIAATTISEAQWGYLGSATAAGGAVLDAANDGAILALLSGDAGAAFSWNSQNLTSVGTIGCGAITSSGTLGLGANSITMSGSIGVTGTRVTKLWAAAVEVSSAAGLTIGGTGIGSIYAAVAQTMHIGTTQVAINRASATLNLAGIGTLECGNITGGTYNALTLTAVAVGFTIAGGSTSKTLTVDDNFVVSTQLTAIGVNTEKVTNANHSGDATGATELTIAAAAVTLAKMANMATDSFIGRTTAGVGVPEILSKGDALAILSVADGADVTGSNAPQAHAASHMSAGGDPVRIDELKVGTDVATLNSSTTEHGLLKKLDNVATNFMNGQGNWVAPAGAGSPGGGTTVLFPWAYDSIVAGSWSGVMTTAYVGNYVFWNSPGANADELNWKTYLGAGTYTVKVLFYRGTDRGIIDIYIDAAEVASFDLYGAADADHVLTDTGNVLAASGVKTIRMVVDGQNGSSTDYIVPVYALIFYRTA